MLKGAKETDIMIEKLQSETAFLVRENVMLKVEKRNKRIFIFE